MGRVAILTVALGLGGACAASAQSAATGDPLPVIVRLVSATGEPVGGAQIRLDPAPRPTVSTVGPTTELSESAVGEYSGRAAAGRYRLRIEALGYGAPATTIMVSHRGSRAWIVRLEPRPISVAELVARGATARTLPGRSISTTRFSEPPPGVTSVAQWLRTLPGVRLRSRGVGGRQIVSLRGSRPEGVLVLLDGLPLNDPLTGAADLSGLSIATLETATLIRGSDAAAGSGAVGGVLRLTSRAGGTNAAEVGVEAGSFGQLALDGLWSRSGAIGVVAISGRLERAANDFSFRNRLDPDRSLEVRRNADVSAGQAALSASFAKLPLSLQARFDRLERGVPGRMGTRLFDQARSSRDGIQLAGRYGRIGGPWLSGGFRAAGTEYSDPGNHIADASRATELRFAAETPLPVYRALTISGRFTREIVTGDGVAGRPVRSQAELTTAHDGSMGRLRTRAALTLSVTGDARVLSPELAGSYDAWPTLRLWARAGQGYRLPTFSDLYVAASYGVRPNPDLVAERIVLDAELGAEWTARDEAIRVRGALFHRDTRDPIVWVASTFAIWSPRNLDRLRSRGVEVDATWRPGSDWRLSGSVTYDRSRGFSAGATAPLPYAPALSGGLEAGWSRGSWAARADVQVLGKRTTSWAATHSLPALTLVGLAGRRSWRLAGLRVGAEARLLNLLDTRYELVELYPEAGRSIELRLVVGSAPREVGERSIDGGER